MAATAKIIEHSINSVGKEIITYELRYWRAVHAELMTHRVFSRNASSSRAIPVKKVLSQVWHDPAGPVHWGRNRPGMQANEELTGWRLWLAKKVWKLAAKTACCFAWVLMQLEAHKQWANRILEPWQYITVVLTATEFTNWYALRDHQDAQPDIAEVAKQMKLAYIHSTPALLKQGEWHLPYVQPYEREGLPADFLVKLSTARCARTSYLTHDRQQPLLEEDLRLYDRLVGSKPWHASPLEHQATPAPYVAYSSRDLNGNFDKTWWQHRKLFEWGVPLPTTEPAPDCKTA